MRDYEAIDVRSIFRETLPESVFQDPKTGENNLFKAKSALMTYYQSKLVALDWDQWSQNFDDVIEEFNRNSVHIDVYVKHGNWMLELSNTIFDDLFNYGLASIAIVSVYLILFLGSMSPLHTRCSVALLGIVCIVIACAAGFGICFEFEWYMTEMAHLLPVFMLAIGVDDMFVICNSVD